MSVMTTLPQLLQKQDIAFTLDVKGLPPETFRVIGFTAQERIFDLFSVSIDVESTSPSISLRDLLDRAATLNILHKYDAPRFLSGVVAEAEKDTTGVHKTAYRLVLLPTLHRLRHGSDCRIFQQITVPDIIRKVLKEHGVTAVEWTLAETHEVREYCVQYRETHLDFIERIAAEEGIWYFFRHEKGRHTLYFTDFPEGGTPPLPEGQEQTYNPLPGGSVKGTFINRFAVRERVRSTDLSQRDYTFKSPHFDLETGHDAADSGLSASYSLYDYPGRYKAHDVGKAFTRYRLERVRADASTGDGRTNTIHLSAGHKFTLLGHADPAQNVPWRLLSVTHRGTQPQASGAEAGEDGRTVYGAAFTVMPAAALYRPPRRRKPLVDGPQIATVVGPAGEEIYTDEHGRVKVQFPWDRYGKADEHSSCWVRVSNNWSGGGWGHISIPRIGHEVIVDFLEGDPDQPIITGRTYHAANRPPYVLPKHKTKMVIRSDTHKGEGFNEISFEDEAGQEQIYVHAQKDQDIHVENNRAKRVDVNQTESIGHNKSIEVGNNHHEVIGGNMTLMVGPNKLQQFVVEKFSALEKALGKKIGGLAGKLGGFGLNMGEGNLVIGVGKNKAETVMLTSSEIVGAAKTTTVGGGYQLFVQGIRNESTMLGAYEEVGQNKVVVVGKRFELVCGKSKLQMDADGTITLDGKDITVTGSSTIKLKAPKINLN